MAIGQRLMKWTWMMREIEVMGIVRRPSASVGTPVGTVDDFDLELDDNYKHLVSSSLGNNPLPWYQADPNPPNGCLHVESYSDHTGITSLAPPPYGINRVETWPIRTKPSDQEFMVRDPDTGALSPLKIGDHVRLRGLWVVENQHEDLCVTRRRGWLYVGCVWMELHPFRWDLIGPVKPLRPNGIQEEQISLAAPIYEETYQRGGILRDVVGRIFVADDGSNYHNSVTANAHIKAPQLPAGFTPHSSLIQYQEVISWNGTGLDYRQVRALTVVDDGIRIRATVVAPVTQYVDGVGIADIHDPANNRSVFQARYTVRWKPRLIPTDSAGEEVNVIQITPQSTGGSHPFLIFLANRGPDPLKLTKIEIQGDTDSVFQLDPVANLPLSVSPMSNLILRGTFSPKKGGSVHASLFVHNDDPVRDVLGVELMSAGIGDLAQVEISPPVVDFGQVRAGTTSQLPITIRNTGSMDAIISEMTTDPADVFRPPFVNQRQTLQTGQSQVINVFFSPKQRGTSRGNAKFLIQGSSPIAKETLIALHGQGIAPVIALDPPMMDFGAVPPGTSRTLPLRILNNGDAPLTISLVALTRGTRNAFFFDPPPGLPINIAANSAVTMRVTFAAGSTPGDIETEEWEFQSDDPINPGLRLALQGMAEGPRISVTPDFIDFGQLEQVPVLAGITVRNQGSSNLIVRSIKLRENTNFSLVNPPPMPVTVAAGSQFVFQIRFEAQLPGFYPDELTVLSNDPRRSRVGNTIQAFRV
jgi:hypothetical protein